MQDAAGVRKSGATESVERLVTMLVVMSGHAAGRPQQAGQSAPEVAQTAGLAADLLNAMLDVLGEHSSPCAALSSRAVLESCAVAPATERAASHSWCRLDGGQQTCSLPCWTLGGPCSCLDSAPQGCDAASRRWQSQSGQLSLLVQMLTVTDLLLCRPKHVRPPPGSLHVLALMRRYSRSGGHVSAQRQQQHQEGQRATQPGHLDAAGMPMVLSLCVHHLIGPAIAWGHKLLPLAWRRGGVSVVAE